MDNAIEEMKRLLNLAVQHKASDIHLAVGLPPVLRIDGKLLQLKESPLTAEKNEALAKSVLRQDLVRRLIEQKDVDFSFGFSNMRFRANVFYERGNVAIALRLLPKDVKTIQQLGLPPILERFTMLAQGLVVITGPTGHGKSTTLASLISHITRTREIRLITIEDPVEYVFENNKSVISQREVGVDVTSFARGLRAALREDPNVLLIGEMRDLETIEATLTLAETGHLVFTTLHTNNAAQAADRVIDVFPAHKQTQIRLQFANVLAAIISQRLIPRISGGRIAACEVMVADNAIRSLIREGKTHQIPSVIQTSAAEGMISLDKVLAEMVSKGEITMDEALIWVQDPKTFKTMVY